MTVHRERLLPSGPAGGSLLVVEDVLGVTRAALVASGQDNRAHEGLVFWLGRSHDEDTLVMAAYAPVTDSGPFRVRASEKAVGAAARAAHRLGLGLVAQVHSHPGWDTRHSDGDDVLVLMPYDGMFSLVVADYGRGSLDPRDGAGLHQYQGDRWVKVPDDAFVVVRALVV